MPSGIYLGDRLDNEGQPGASLTYRFDRHGLVIGPTGCGKTTSFVIGQLLGDELNGSSQIVIDPKGEVACVCALKRAQHGKVKILDPFGMLAGLAAKHRQLAPLVQAGLVESAGFNPLSQLDPASTAYYDDCAAIGEALIKVEGKDPHWAESAQGLLTGLIMWAKIRDGARANLGTIRAMLTEPEAYDDIKRGGKTLKELKAGLVFHVRKIIGQAEAAATAERAGKQGMAPAELLATIAGLVARFDNPTTETRSIVSTADTQTRWLLSPLIAADLARPGINFAALKREATCVLVILPSSRLRTHSVWLRLVIVTALRQLYVAGGLRTTFIVDEMPALGYLPPLVDAYALVRGYNIGIIGIAQDFNQLKALYSEHWESFIANAGYLVCWGANDLASSEWMSKRHGEEDVITTTVGRSQGLTFDPQRASTSDSQNITRRRRKTPQEMIALARGTAIVFTAGRDAGRLMRLQHYKERHFTSAGFNPFAA